MILDRVNTSRDLRYRLQVRAQVQTYLDANPQVKDDLQRIRQPAVDYRTRCR